MEVNKALLLSNMLSSTESIENAEIASFNASCVSPLDITVDIDPVQDLHGYDNPWPGGGGKNKFDEQFRQGSALDLSNTARVVASKSIYVEQGKTYTFSASNYSAFNYVINSAQADSLPISGSYNYCGAGLDWLARTNTFTATNSGYVFVCVRKPDNSDIVPSDVANVKMQFEESSTATAYAPYSNISPISGWTKATISHSGADTSNPTEYEIPFSTEVYGGKLNVETGELVVDRGIVKLSEFSFSQYSTPSTHVFRATFTNVIPNVKPPATNVSDWDGLCDTFSYKPYNPLTASDNGKYAITTTSTNRVVFIDHRYSSAEDFENANADVTIVYPLVTPVTMTLTPVEIHSLLGYNNVWADTGNVSVRNITCNADVLELLLKTKLIGEC